MEVRHNNNSNANTNNNNLFYIQTTITDLLESTFSALTMLVRQQKGHLACKNHSSAIQKDFLMQTMHKQATMCCY